MKLQETRSRHQRQRPVVALPPPDLSLEQDQEWCVVQVDGEWRQVRLHDYNEVFKVPGLYELILYDILKCDSPATVIGQLGEALREQGVSPADLRVLDLGAGNGMVGEELQRIGVEHITGLDIVPEAVDATERDRPGLYDDYVVADLTRLDKATEKQLAGHRFNALTCVAALGFGDIPTDAFLRALEFVEPNGWVAFNIKEEFLQKGHGSGFGELVRTMVDDGRLKVQRKLVYDHRLGTDGEALRYVALVARRG